MLSNGSSASSGGTGHTSRASSRRPRQFVQLGALLAANPRTREALLDLARRHNLKRRKAVEVASELFARLLHHAEEVVRGKPSRGPFARYARSNAQSHEAERRPINPEAVPAGAALNAPAASREKPQPHNRPPDTTPPTIKSQTGNKP